MEDSRATKKPSISLDETNRLLSSICEELKNLSKELRTQNERLQLLETKQTGQLTPPPNPIAHELSPVVTPANFSHPRDEVKLATLNQSVYIYENNLVTLPGADWDYSPSSDWNMPLGWDGLFNSFGDLWTLPFDGRLTLSFQKHMLKVKTSTEIKCTIEKILHFQRELDARPPQFEWDRHHYRNHFVITDWFEKGASISYMVGRTRSVPNTKIWVTGDFVPRTNDPHGPIARPSTAPWRRVIQIQGLCSVSTDEGGYFASRCPYFDDPLWFSQVPNNLLWTAVLRHLRSVRRRKMDLALSDPACVHFHLTFYEIVNLPRDVEPRHKEWRNGMLHSDKIEYWPDEFRERLDIRDFGRPPTVRYLRESAYTLFGIAAHRPDLPYGEDEHLKLQKSIDTAYWTIVELSPEHFHESHAIYDEELPPALDEYDMVDIQMLSGMSKFVKASIDVIISRWEGLADYFDRLLREKQAFLDPHVHDSLLSDDETFSRSKRYFWAINTLKELESSISENLVELETFTQAHIEAVGQSQTSEYLYYQHAKLRDIQLSLRDKREEAVALRDGLFSASAVIESRASTRLGENVRLLTWVSIFFLPLSFCMSMWSINDDIFSLSSLIFVSILVSVLTYAVVFNINNLANMVQESGEGFRVNVIKAMQHDNNRTWAERGSAFSLWRPVREVKRRPSDWRIAHYLLDRLVRSVVWLVSSWKATVKAAASKFISRTEDRQAEQEKSFWETIWTKWRANGVAKTSTMDVE